MTPRWLNYLPPFLRRRIAGRLYLLRVIDNTGWVFGERILRYATGFLIGIWVARSLGPEQYGLLNYASAFVLVFAFLGGLGLDGLAVRDMVRDPGTRDEMLGTLLVMRLIGGIAMMLAVAAAIAILQPADSRAPALILLIGLGQMLLAFESIDCWFQANVASRYTVVARVAALLAITGVRVVLVVMQAPLVAFAAAIFGECLLLCVGLLFAYRHSGQRLNALRPSLARAKAFFAEGWPLLLAALVAAVWQRVDQVILGQLAGYAAVGAYAIAVRIIETTYIIPTVLVTSIFPAMVKSKALDAALYRAQIQKLFDVVLWVALAIAVGLSLLAGPIVRTLVGSQYTDAAPVLAILAWMPVFIFFGVVRQKWLFAENQLRAVMVVEICTCALNVLANLLLIPRYGAVGAAVASLVGAAGATLLIAPFSPSVRQSLIILLRGVGAPLRLLRSN